MINKINDEIKSWIFFLNISSFLVDFFFSFKIIINYYSLRIAINILCIAYNYNINYSINHN